MGERKMKQITDRLFELQDTGFRDFHSSLIPDMDREKIIGVRMPDLRRLAKELARTPLAGEFLKELPHQYYEENNLHGLFIGLIYKEPEDIMDRIDEFLPYVDNWATCDMLAPEPLKKDIRLLRERITPWLSSDHTYRVRFAIVAMLRFLLDDGFEEEDLYRLARIKSGEYYINMAVAWYYSFALIKQYDSAIKVIEGRRLDPWVHNKSIQKAIESYRVPDDRKDYLRTLRIKRSSKERR